MVYPGFEHNPSRLRVQHRHTELPGIPLVASSCFGATEDNSVFSRAFTDPIQGIKFIRVASGHSGCFEPFWSL
jgi:hypothetical protein